VSEHVTLEQCEAALCILVRVIHGEEEYQAFLVRPDFVVCFGENLPDGSKVLEIYHVSPTEDPNVYRFVGEVKWCNPFLHIRSDVLVKHLPDSILDILNMNFLDFLLVYTSDWYDNVSECQR
jgi:hypothetical protein